MRRSHFTCLTLFLLVMAYEAPAQTIFRVPETAPFNIEKGSSFSASAGGQRTARPTSEAHAATARITEQLLEAVEIIQQHHVAGSLIDTPHIVKSSINAMLSELDPHSKYLDPAEFAELLGEHESEYSGTGSSISNFIKDGRVDTYVVATHAGSAAARAGLQYGDRIVAVDGQPVSGLLVDVVRDRIRGPRGSNVSVTVERAASGTVEQVDLRRERVSQPSISNYTILRDGVGYIAISNGFRLTTASELNAAMKELQRRGMRSLVLDLRGNGGGILEQAIEVAERFLPAGATVISQRGRHKSDERIWTSRNRAPDTMPLVLLVDRQTASASEVVAGSLQDNDRALIVGENTFGKGLVQNVIELPLGSGLTLTTARYFTPSGRSLQRDYDARGRYDYFLNRASASSTAASRTLINRTVYSGHGISPDETAASRMFDATRSALIDPVFFFVREKVAKDQTDRVMNLTERDRVRQSLIFEDDPLPNGLIEEFRSYVKSRTSWKISDETLEKEASFIEGQLRYQLTLSAFGAETAETVMAGYDSEISQAVQAMPRARRLAEDAAKARAILTADEKARRVASPAGQGRNRRN